MDQTPSTAQDLMPTDPDMPIGLDVPTPARSSGNGVNAAAGLEVATDGVRAVARRRRRFVAWLVDYLVVIVPGLGLVAFVVASLIQGLPAFVGAVAAHAGWSRVVQLFTHRSTFGLGNAAADEWVAYVLPLLIALVAVPVLQFMYQGIMLTWRRRTIGMMIADIRVDANRTKVPLGRGAAMLRAAATTFVETGLMAVALVTMVVGQFTLGVGLWGIAVLAFWANALAAVGPSRRTIIDRMAGAVVVRRGLYAVAAHAVSATASIAGRRAADAALTAGRVVSDAAAVTGDLAHLGVAALARTAPLRQVLDSPAIAQAQAISTAGAERARELGGQAADRARVLGGRARTMWRDRETARADTAGIPQEITDSYPDG